MLIDPQGRIDNAGKATITEAVSNGYVNGSNAGIYEANDTQLDESVKIYPNPTSNLINLNFASPIIKFESILFDEVVILELTKAAVATSVP